MRKIVSTSAPKPALAGMILLILSATTVIAEEEFWRVTPEQAKCLVENIQTYLSLGLEIIVIPIATCPFPSLSVESLDGLENYGGVSKIYTKKEGADYDEILSFTAKDLACLKSSMIRIEGGSAYIPRSVACVQ
jgi:hypothetical protein